MKITKHICSILWSLEEGEDVQMIKNTPYLLAWRLDKIAPEWQVIKHIPTQHKHEKSLKILLNNTVIQRFYSSSILNENSVYLSFWQQ